MVCFILQSSHSACFFLLKDGSQRPNVSIGCSSLLAQRNCERKKTVKRWWVSDACASTLPGRGYSAAAAPALNQSCSSTGGSAACCPLQAAGNTDLSLGPRVGRRGNYVCSANTHAQRHTHTHTLTRGGGLSQHFIVFDEKNEKLVDKYLFVYKNIHPLVMSQKCCFKHCKQKSRVRNLLANSAGTTSTHTVWKYREGRLS